MGGVPGRLATCGASLAELLCVLAVLAVLVATAAAPVAAVRERARLFEAARQLAGDLARARLLAVARHQPVTVRFRPAAAGYEVRVGASGARGGVRWGRLPAGIRIERTTVPGDAITYRPAGHAVPFGSVTLRSRAGGRRRVVVGLAGRVRIE